MKTVTTVWAKVYVAVGPKGFRDSHKWMEPIREYVDEVGLCVTVTKTEYVYTNGIEDGIIVGLINYPRFPSSYLKIKGHALALAKILKKKLNQKRVTVELPNETIMLGSSSQKS